MAEFKTGDRVRIKDRADWPSPPGYRLANAEGVVTKWTDLDDLDEVMGDFRDYVCVQVDKDRDLNLDKGLFFRKENLKKI
jgi:hypothetical protein